LVPQLELVSYREGLFFDCVFCELSVHTNVLTLERHTYVSVNEVLKELRNFPTQGVDYIALSGAGEPTLAANMGEVIDALHQKYSVPVLVLSNGSTVFMKDVQEELRKLMLLSSRSPH